MMQREGAVSALLKDRGQASMRQEAALSVKSDRFAKDRNGLLNAVLASQGKPQVAASFVALRV
jgi:hypothetical protein